MAAFGLLVAGVLVRQSTPPVPDAALGETFTPPEAVLRDASAPDQRQLREQPESSRQQPARLELSRDRALQAPSFESAGQQPSGNATDRFRQDSVASEERRPKSEALTKAAPPEKKVATAPSISSQQPAPATRTEVQSAPKPATDSAATAMRFYSSKPPASEDFYRRTTGAGPVLEQFTLTVAANRVTLKDSDGSTYSGVLEASLGAARQLTPNASATNISFRVEGTNVTLRQKIVVNATVEPSTTTRSFGVAPREASGARQRITGTIQVPGRPLSRLEAVSDTTSADRP